MSDLPDEITRINALTSNARNTWFALLGVLVFVGITLMGVEHIDFYGVNRATKLPLVDVDVPTSYFFIAAPILTAAIYGYFHLYLVRLWDALGAAPACVEDNRLGDIISPWLVSDAALYYRNRYRNRRCRDGCSTPRTLEGGAMMLNFLLAWGFGLIILGFLWWQSLPARDFLMSAIAGMSFAISVLVGISSLAMMHHRMRHAFTRPIPWLWRAPFQIFGLAIGAAILMYQSYVLTEGPYDELASLHMIDEQIVARPNGWLPYRFAKAEFRAGWCRREQIADCAQLGPREMELEGEWLDRRFEEILSLQYPAWHKTARSKPDLRRAKLISAFLTGVSLWDARLDSVVLNHAQMEGVNLNFADLRNISLEQTHLQRAVFDYSFMTGTAEIPVFLDRTDLSAAENKGGAIRHTDLRAIQFDKLTDFRNAFLDGSVIYTDAFAAQMGAPLDKPCQWIDETLEDAEFHALWHWWITLSPYQKANPGRNLWGEGVAPPAWKDIEPVSPERLAELGLTDCTWKDDTMIDTLMAARHTTPE